MGNGNFDFVPIKGLQIVTISSLRAIESTASFPTHMSDGSSYMKGYHRIGVGVQTYGIRGHVFSGPRRHGIMTIYEQYSLVRLSSGKKLIVPLSARPARQTKQS